MRTLYQVDAFTRMPLTGNPAGVVLDADGLTDADMLAVARELNNSETAFVLPADGPDHDVRVRFFTPSTEVPTCGHATIGTHYVRALVHDLPSGSLVQKTGAGLLQAIRIERDGDRVRIAMHQGRAELASPLGRPRVEHLMHALGTTSDALSPKGPVQVVSTGHSKVLVGLRDRSRVDELVPDAHALTALSHDIGSNGYFVFAIDEADPAGLSYSRMFAPAIGVSEDPVTGNGHGPLGAYLLHHGIATTTVDRLSFVGRQGVAMGRPGEVQVDAERDAHGDIAVTVTGDAIIAFRAELTL